MQLNAALTARFAASLAFLDQVSDDKNLGVAVSGGGDSMALLDLARVWGTEKGKAIKAVTVDHGLRETAASEIDLVARYCSKHAISHDILRWHGWDKAGNLQDTARKARRQLIAEWTAKAGCHTVLYGHTADDQAENFLMRLARGSGVDGLAGIAVYDPEAAILRPLLRETRADLRDYLRAQGVEWAEDPSNQDSRFDRVKARQMMVHLAALGLTAERLLQTTDHMARARLSLRHAAADFAARYVRAEIGDLVFAPRALDLDIGDTPARVLAGALQWIGGSDYRPRYAALRDAASAVRAGQQRTLNGVMLVPDGGGARLIRESAAANTPAMSLGGETAVVWDKRWQIARDPLSAKAKIGAGITVRALGDDIQQIKGWREAGIPRASLIASPAIWQNNVLIAAPIAGFGTGWAARIVADFHSFLLSH